MRRLQVTQWGSVHIEKVPPGWRPLLVFLNTKSGPQTGARLRRRFLRCLNALQVRAPGLRRWPPSQNAVVAQGIVPSVHACGCGEHSCTSA